MFMFIEQIPGRCIIPLKGVFVHLADILEDWSTMQSFVRQCCQISLFAKNTKDKKIAKVDDMQIKLGIRKRMGYYYLAELCLWP